MLLALDGRRQAYDLIGPESGPVLCLAHCLSSDMGVWADQLPALVMQGWRVLRIDMRGHGGSEPSRAPCTMADYAADVIRVLDFLGFERVHFAGVSIGGMIGQQLGVDHGERLHSLLLSGTSPQAVPGGEAMWEARFAAIESAGSVGAIADAAMTRWVTDAFRTARPERWAQVRETIAATSVPGYRAGAEAIIAFDILDRLPLVRTPTLVICGDEDTGTPPTGNRRIAELVPGARYVEMARARHLPMVEYPDAYSRLLLEWLAALA